MVDLRNPPRWCKCRTCGKKFDSNKSKADLTGYCSQKCLIEKARQHGWRKLKQQGHSIGRQRTYYSVLSEHGEIGYVEWIEPAVVSFGRKLPAKSGSTVWVFTAECADHGRQVIAVTDYDPQVGPLMTGNDEHLWDLLTQYLKVVAGDSALPALQINEYLDQYAASEFQVDKLPVLTRG